MSGFFGVASKEDCVMDLFFGTDYHSHLGTRRGGMAVYGERGFVRSIHNIENSPFRTKFDTDLDQFVGNIGVGCISDSEAQPLLVNSHLGSFAITTIGRINNIDELRQYCFDQGKTHFLEMSGGVINPTEMVAALINQEDDIVKGIQHAQNMIKGSMSIMLLFPDKIYCARDKLGRTPVVIGKKENAFCVTFESSAFINLGYHHYKDLGPGEIAYVTSDSFTQLVKPGKDMKICSFLWVYFGYPTATYEGINVEKMRYDCGEMLAKRDNVKVDCVAGVPDSGLAHAIGYANHSGYPFTRPFIKYTPTWPRSFMPTNQNQRNLIARMKLIPVKELIKDKTLLLIDDSIVRGTQLRETTEFLYDSGAKAVHVRPACPPIMYGCKFLNFSRSTSDMDLISRRVIHELENGQEGEAILKEYVNPDSPKYQAMVDEICKRMKFASLRYHRLDDMIEAIGLPACKLCTYCFNGEE